MKKMTILLIVIVFMVIGYAAYNATTNIYGTAKLVENLSDFKVYLSNLKVDNTEVEGINETKDEFTIEDINGDISVDIVNDSTEYDTEAYLDCDVNQSWSFDYTGVIQTFTAPVTGTYKLETWGAAGGGAQAGFGGYSTGNVSLSANEQIFIVVGGAGNISTNENNGGGYNGGGNGSNVNQTGSGGGGATHIAKTNRGLLSSYSSHINELLIVAGGGGGSTSTFHDNYGIGGSGGGYLGVTGGYLNQLNWSFYGTGGSQTTGGVCYLYDTDLADSDSFGTFGLGGNHGYESGSNVGGSGGGGGLYGGGGSSRGHGQAGGGSGYIGNSELSEKAMYCYNCTESSEESTKTISTTCVNTTATANCAKQGDGYARITLTSSPTSITTDKTTISAQESISQTLTNVTGKSLTCKLKVNKISRTEVKYAKRYIYDKGIKDTNFTDITCGAFENKGSCTVGENSITITNPSRPYSNAYIITTEKVDLTNFKTLNFNLTTSGTNKYHFITIRTSPLTDNDSYFDSNSTLLERIPIGYNGIFIVDISAIKESVYISLCQRQSTNDTTSSTAVVNQIWLE